MKSHLLSFSIITILVAGSSCQVDSTSKSSAPERQANENAGTGAHAFDSVELQMRRLPAFYVSMGVPRHWKVSEFVEQQQRVWTAKSPRTDSTKFAANYVVNAVPRQKGVPLRNYGDFFITSLRDKHDTFTLVNRSEDRINGYASTTIDYIHRQNGLNLGGTTTFYFLDDTVVVVNFGALNEPKGDYVRYRGLYTRILSTIKFLKE